MVIFHSYVKLPEGTHDPKKTEKLQLQVLAGSCCCAAIAFEHRRGVARRPLRQIHGFCDRFEKWLYRIPVYVQIAILMIFDAQIMIN